MKKFSAFSSSGLTPPPSTTTNCCPQIVSIIVSGTAECSVLPTSCECSVLPTSCEYSVLPTSCKYSVLPTSFLISGFMNILCTPEKPLLQALPIIQVLSVLKELPVLSLMGESSRIYTESHVGTSQMWISYHYRCIKKTWKFHLHIGYDELKITHQALRHNDHVFLEHVNLKCPHMTNIFFKHSLILF